MTKLIFVYNADSGYFNMLADMAHKIFSPSTYPCSLCDLTYGVLKIRPEWDDFVKNAPVPFEFLHKDEFLLHYPALQDTDLPVILAETDGQISPMITAPELNHLPSIAALKSMVLARI